jgi:hypothetical protein
MANPFRVPPFSPEHKGGEAWHFLFTDLADVTVQPISKSRLFWTVICHFKPFGNG